MESEPSFLPLDRQSTMFPGHPYGRTLHFGIREHAMGGILNGIKAHGGTRPYCGTCLTFSDYMHRAFAFLKTKMLVGPPPHRCAGTASPETGGTSRPGGAW